MEEVLPLSRGRLRPEQHWDSPVGSKSPSPYCLLPPLPTPTIFPAPGSRGEDGTGRAMVTHPGLSQDKPGNHRGVWSSGICWETRVPPTPRGRAQDSAGHLEADLPRTIHTSYRVGTNGFAERGMQPPQGLLPPLNCHDYNQTMTFNVGSGPCTGRAETAEIASRRPAWVRKAQCRVLGRVLEQKNISGKRNKTPNESKLSEERCRSDFLGFAKRTRVT